MKEISKKIFDGYKYVDGGVCAAKGFKANGLYCGIKENPTKKPDLDNISKVICDAISHQGGIWHDDSQITSEMLSKHYSDKPRVEVCIEEG